MDVVTAAYEDVPFSELLHHPAATAERLESVRALRLRRRDAGDLALMRIDQLERDESVVEFTARLLTGLVRSENSEVIRRLLPEAVPWVTFLPETDFDVAPPPVRAGPRAGLDKVLQRLRQRPAKVQLMRPSTRPAVADRILPPY